MTARPSLVAQASAILGVSFVRIGRFHYYHDGPTDAYYRATLADLRMARAYRRNRDAYSLWCAATMARPASRRMAERIREGA